MVAAATLVNTVEQLLIALFSHTNILAYYSDNPTLLASLHWTNMNNPAIMRVAAIKMDYATMSIRAIIAGHDNA
jgi:hypothetical protein